MVLAFGFSQGTGAQAEDADKQRSQQPEPELTLRFDADSDDLQRMLCSLIWGPVQFRSVLIRSDEAQAEGGFELLSFGEHAYVTAVPALGLDLGKAGLVQLNSGYLDEGAATMFVRNPFRSSALSYSATSLSKLRLLELPTWSDQHTHPGISLSGRYPREKGGVIMEMGVVDGSINSDEGGALILGRLTYVEPTGVLGVFASGGLLVADSETAAEVLIEQEVLQQEDVDFLKENALGLQVTGGVSFSRQSRDVGAFRLSESLALAGGFSERFFQIVDQNGYYSSGLGLLSGEYGDGEYQAGDERSLQYWLSVGQKLRLAKILSDGGLLNSFAYVDWQLWLRPHGYSSFGWSDASPSFFPPGWGVDAELGLHPWDKLQLCSEAAVIHDAWEQESDFDVSSTMILYLPGLTLQGCARFNGSWTGSDMKTDELPLELSTVAKSSFEKNVGLRMRTGALSLWFSNHLLLDQLWLEPSYRWRVGEGDWASVMTAGLDVSLDSEEDGKNDWHRGIFPSSYAWAFQFGIELGMAFQQKGFELNMNIDAPEDVFLDHLLHTRHLPCEEPWMWSISFEWEPKI